MVRKLCLVFLAVTKLTFLTACSDPLEGVIPEFDMAQAEAPVVAQIDSLMTTVRSRPESATAWGELGISFFVHGYLAPAIAAFDQAVSVDSNAFSWTYLNAFARERAEHSDYLQWYERALRKGQNYPPLYHRLGFAYLEDDGLNRAEVLFRQAVRIDSTLPEGHVGLARIHFRNKNLAESDRSIRRALRRAPRHREANMLLGTILKAQGEAAAAERQISFANSLPQTVDILDPLVDQMYEAAVSSPWRRRRGLALMLREDFTGAVKEFQAVVDVKPTAYSHYDLGHALHRAKRLDEALEQYEKAIAVKSDYMQAHSNLGALLFQQERLDEAIVRLNEALKIDPGHVQSAFNLFNVFKSRGETAPAIDLLGRILEQKPNDVNLGRQLAWLLATVPDDHLRDGARAIKLASAICEKTSWQDPVALDVLAAAYAAEGNFRKATEHGKTARDIAAQSSNKRLLADIDKRLALYKGGTAYREPFSGPMR